MLLRKKEDIEAWLNEYHVQNYELIEDKKYGYVVNVNGNVDLKNRKLRSIKIKFNEVNGFFDCSENQLKLLKGCPEIVNRGFSCNNN